MHNQISPFLCDSFSMFVRFMCDFCIVSFFVRFFAILAFSQGNAQKMPQKKSQKKRKYIAKNAKAKTRTLLIAFVLLFDCMCCDFLCMFVALFVPFCAFVLLCLCMFLHLFSGQMRSFAFLRFLHSKASFGDLFLRFLSIFSGLVLHYFCIVYAFFVLLRHQN